MQRALCFPAGLAVGYILTKLCFLLLVSLEKNGEPTLLLKKKTKQRREQGYWVYKLWPMLCWTCLAHNWDSLLMSLQRGAAVTEEQPHALEFLHNWLLPASLAKRDGGCALWKCLVWTWMGKKSKLFKLILNWTASRCICCQSNIC